jgi:hypothetical protein
LTSFLSWLGLYPLVKELYFSVVSFVFFFLASFASAPKAEDNTITLSLVLSMNVW